MANNLTLSVTLTGDGRQLSGTLRDAQNDVREFGTTTERESRKADTALTAPGRSAVTVSDHLRTTQREARAFGTEATQGGREATQALSQTSQQVQTTNSHFNLLRTTVGLALGAFSVRQIAGMADGWSDMQSVVGAAIGDMSAAGDMMERITDIANASYAPLEQTARTYASNVSALRDLGRTAADTADYTESLNHMLVLTATRGQQAESVQNALSRAMAVGRLQADGLETVLANGGEVAQALANQLGVTVSQLRGLATEGRITGDVIASALINSLDDVRERAGEMPATIEDGFVRIGTSATRLVGELDQAMGASEGVAGILIGAADLMNAAIDPLVDNIDNIQFAATAVAVVLAGRYVGAIATSQAALAVKTAVVATTTGAINLLTGATTRQAAAATAMAGATRVAAGALALIGGPAGAAVIAAGAIYYFREELGLTQRASKTTEEFLGDLREGMGDLDEAAIGNRLDVLVHDLIEVSLQAQETFAQLERLREAPRMYGQGMAADQRVLEQQTEQRLEEQRNKINALTQTIQEHRDRRNELTSTSRDNVAVLEDMTVTAQRLAEAETATAAATNELTRATNAQATAIENLRNRLVPHRSQTLQLAQDQNTLNLAFAMGRITASEYLYMIGALQTAYIEAQNDADDLATSTTNALYTMDGAMEELRTNGLRRLDNGFADLWLGAVDGSRNATDTIKRMWDQTLAELLHMTITRPITVQLAASMGLAGGAGGQQAGGFGISPGSVGNMWNALQGGFNGIQWGGAGGGQAYGGGGWANAATSGTGATGYFGGSMRNFSGVQGLAGLGAGFAGNYLGGQLFGQGRHSNTLGTIGGLAGTYLGGPIGALLGSGLGSALGGLFGGRRWNETGSGVNLGVSGGDITGNQFSEQHSSGGLFRRSRRRTQTSALDGEFVRALQDVYDATKQSLAATIEVLGFQSSSLAGFTTGLTRIDTKGLSAKRAEAKIQEWLSNTLNALAIHSVGDVSQYAFSGETTIDTLERLATVLSGINPILEQLHGNTLAASLAGGDAAAHLAALAGGLDEFTARADYYYQNILTEAERQERAVTAAARAMGAFTARTGRVIESTDALRELVDGIDLTTASGRELYNEAMNLAPALVEIERGLERVGQRFDQMLQEAESALATAEQQAHRAWQTFDQQQFGMQLELLSLMGDSEGALALERERELATIDESLRPMRERIWAMQDEITVQQNATTAARNYQRELSRVRDQLNQQLANIGNWLDQQQATSGSPETNLATAQEQLARQLVLAENGDRSALQNITQYAQQVLEANRAFNASSVAGQRIQEDVYAAIRALPDAISAEEYLATEIRDALQSVVISAMPTDERLAFELSRELIRLDTNQLTVSQVRTALAPIATDAEISKLIREVDVSGDGIITRQELGNARLSGLAGGIGATLKPMFDAIDLDASGLIDWNEFYGAFNGLASDQELRRIFQKLDADGSGTISRLEALNRSNEGTEANTDSLDKQARDQLRELSGLVSEMARSTDQFVSLNSTMVSLRESINALGVAQEEVARIERERVAAEQRARERVELSRQIGEVETTVAGHLAEADYRMGRRAFFMDATKEHSGNVSAGVEDRVLNYIHENTSRSDMTAAEREQMHSWMLRVFGDGSPEYLYALSRMGSFRNESLARDAQRQADQSAQLLEQLRGQLAVNGSHRTGLEYVPFDGYVAELHRGEKVLTAEDADAMRNVSTSRFMFPQTPLPSFPLLGNNDVVETLRDLKREVAELRRDNARLQGESNKHLAAANNQRGAAAKGQINAIERSNKMLKRMEDDKRLEAAKR
ncbi:tape measure protein [Halomonas sp. M1]|uniref:tape measure protein n=1 Tax=Halomonas sp. M1 TaxID=3035470 RepID=UPI00248526A8|nr:tape measure protein [Halomonas sp. M1]WFE70134.1 tape measure protein [Halomonas sp. M1]